MSQIEVPYEEMKNEMVKEFLKHNFGFLATSEQDNVRAGNMWMVSDGLTLYCFTWLKTRKYKQIMANPNVAFAIDNLQVEGVASLKGHPLDVPEFIKAYKENQPDAYERRSRTYFARSETDVRVIEIAPKRICRYRGKRSYNIPVAHFDILDVVKREAYSIRDMDLFYARTPAYRE